MRLLPPLAGLPFAAALLLVAAPASAQILSVYATLAPTVITHVQTGSTLTGSSTSTSQFTNASNVGIGGGLTFNLVPLGPVRLGLDLRGSTKPNSVGFDTALAGIKLTIKPPVLPIRPYIQGSAGYLATRTGNVSTITTGTSVTTIGGTYTNKYAAVEGIAGLDYRLGRFIDFRVIEIGVGKGFNTGVNLGSSGTTDSVNIVTINTGLVVHI